MHEQKVKLGQTIEKQLEDYHTLKNSANVSIHDLLLQIDNLKNGKNKDFVPFTEIPDYSDKKPHEMKKLYDKTPKMKKKSERRKSNSSR